MDKNSIVEKLVAIIENITGNAKEQIRIDVSVLDELQLTSLELMMIIGEAEEAFSVQIQEEELMSIVSVNDLADLIVSKQAN